MTILALACTLMVVDGDTLRCNNELLRLIGIDAPEMPGHCREERDCAPGDPLASKNALQALSQGSPEISRKGQDRYGRTLVRVKVNGVDLSCAQLAAGHAIYRADWDQFGLVGDDCNVAERQVFNTTSQSTRTPARRAAQGNKESGWSYRNCGEARRAGATPLRRGTPGYGIHMDGDGDGVACEPYRR